MENKINIAEILKNCPKGMELDCTIFNDVTLYRIDTSSENEYPIRIETKNGNFLDLTEYGTYINVEESKCLIFPKGKTTWEGFQLPFKDGDIVVCTNKSCTFTAIFKSMRDGSSFYRYGVMYDNKFRCLVNDWSSFNDSCRLATEEEKQKLFDVIKDNGYKWNAETKTLEKLPEPKFKVGDIIRDITGICKVKIAEVNVENRYYLYKSLNINGLGIITFNRQDDWELVPTKFDITTLKPFKSEVLVRDSVEEIWKPYFFGCLYDSNDCPYMVVGGIRWKYCIPYEGNEHLLSTTDDCDDFYKTW